ncbi:SMRP1 protein, partial [Cochlearius cochlearius]|nr:SMRP1 protein [Cochlearius cochlearius]
MFLFSKKHKTPISTYTDSYRPPCSVKKTVHEQVPQQLWKENKFVTQGLTMPPVQNPSSQGQPEQLINVATQEYYRSSVDRVAYWPEKYCLARPEGKYSPVFVNDVNYITWRTGPYNSAAWNKHSSYLPPLTKDARMETFLHRIPVTYPVTPTCLNQFEKELVADRLPVYTVTGRGPFQLYYSPCSGRHYCLREMDYYVDGARAIRRNAGSQKQVFSSSSSPDFHPPTADNFICSPRWDTSHFKRIGGVQRGSYTIHPEFVSEAYSAPCC